MSDSAELIPLFSTPVFKARIETHSITPDLIDELEYTLYPDGTVPEYIADGGYYGKSNGGTAPQDFDFIGATVDGSKQLGLGELTSEADVKTYLDTYTSTWKIRNEDNPGPTVGFDQAASAAFIWSKKIA